MTGGLRSQTETVQEQSWKEKSKPRCWKKSKTVLHKTRRKTLTIYPECQTFKWRKKNLVMFWGITYLLPKNRNTVDPAQYRPTPCLSTIHTFLSSILYKKIYNLVHRPGNLSVMASKRNYVPKNGMYHTSYPG